MKKKIVIGLAQFGLPYGVANKLKHDRKKQFSKVINFAQKKNIKFLHTSKYYGNANDLIQKKKINSFTIYLKYKPEDILNIKNIDSFNLKKIFDSKSIILMLDGFENLNNDMASKVYQLISYLKKKNFIKKFGYSVYSFKNLKKICKIFRPDIVQFPYNILDRRLEKNNLISYLKTKKIEIHVRSIFLQGVLLQKISELPKYFLKWKKILNKFNNQMNKCNVSNLEGCINFVLRNKYIDKVLIGVDHVDQLKQILEVKKNKKIIFPQFVIKNQELINPSKWKN